MPWYNLNVTSKYLLAHEPDWNFGQHLYQDHWWRNIRCCVQRHVPVRYFDVRCGYIWDHQAKDNAEPKGNDWGLEKHLDNHFWLTNLQHEAQDHKISYGIVCVSTVVRFTRHAQGLFDWKHHRRIKLHGWASLKLHSLAFTIIYLPWSHFKWRYGDKLQGLWHFDWITGSHSRRLYYSINHRLSRRPVIW